MSMSVTATPPEIMPVTQQNKGMLGFAANSKIPSGWESMRILTTCPLDISAEIFVRRLDVELGTTRRYCYERDKPKRSLGIWTRNSITVVYATPMDSIVK